MKYFEVLLDPSRIMEANEVKCPKISTLLVESHHQINELHCCWQIASNHQGFEEHWFAHWPARFADGLRRWRFPCLLTVKKLHQGAKSKYIFNHIEDRWKLEIIFFKIFYLLKFFNIYRRLTSMLLILFSRSWSCCWELQRKKIIIDQKVCRDF